MKRLMESDGESISTGKMSAPELRIHTAQSRDSGVKPKQTLLSTVVKLFEREKSFKNLKEITGEIKPLVMLSVKNGLKGLL